MNEKGITVSHKAKNNSEQSEQDEIKLLRKEVERLKLEREILKKAAAFFAKESL
jgi:transposase